VPVPYEPVIVEVGVNVDPTEYATILVPARVFHCPCEVVPNFAIVYVNPEVKLPAWNKSIVSVSG
jgi:hypothetical protein